MCHPFDGPMVLFYRMIHILHLPNDDGGAMHFVVPLDRGFIGLAPIDGDRFGDSETTNRLREKAERGLGIPVLREQKVNGLPGLINGSIPVLPRAFHVNIRLIYPPAASHRALAAVERLFQLSTILHDPALDGRALDRHPALRHQCFNLPIAQEVSDIPVHDHEHDLLWEMGSLEAHRHRHFPSRRTCSHREGSYPKLTPNENLPQNLRARGALLHVVGARWPLCPRDRLLCSSAPMGTPFSAIEHRMSRTRATNRTARTAEPRKASKYASDNACCCRTRSRGCTVICRDRRVAGALQKGRLALRQEGPAGGNVR